MATTDAKTKIKHAFLELLAEKDIDKISILDIVRRAGVGRSTYYYHYFDQHEILDDIFEEVFQRFFEMQKSVNVNSDELTGKNRLEYSMLLYSIPESMIGYLLENNDIMTTLFFGSVSKEFETSYQHYFEKAYGLLHPCNTAYERYLCSYLCSGQFHLLKIFVKYGSEADRKDMTNLMFDINCLVGKGPTKYHEDIDRLYKEFVQANIDWSSTRK